VARHTARVGALLREELQHREEEVADFLALLGAEVVLLPQHIRQRPVPETMDVAELSLAVEDLLGPLPGQAERLGERAQQFDDLRDVVIVLAVFRAGLWVEEVVSGDEFEDLAERLACRTVRISIGPVTYHAGHTPHVRTGTPLGTQDDLRRAILPGLDVVGEVVPDPTRVAQVGDLDGDDLVCPILVRRLVRGVLVERYAGYLSFQQVTTSTVSSKT